VYIKFYGLPHRLIWGQGHHGPCLKQSLGLMRQNETYFFFVCDTARDKFFVERALSNRKSSLLNLARAHDTGSFWGRVVWNTVQKRACTTADNVTAWKTPSNCFTKVDHKLECLYFGLDIEGGKRAETYARENRCT
jgi:hypothetical protein